MIGETVWLSLNQMAALFERDKSVISRHIRKVFDEGELRPEGTVATFATVQTRERVVATFATTATDGKTYQVEHCNLALVYELIEHKLHQLFDDELNVFNLNESLAA